MTANLDNLHNGDLAIGQLPLGKRPALIAVDFSNGFTQIKSPLGGDFESQISANLSLVVAASNKNVPVFFTTVVYDKPEQASVFRQRLPALNILQSGSHWVDIHKRFSAFVDANNVIKKQHPSAFFQTSLINKLQAMNIDTLLITGLTTSGCVRATCVDGLQHNFVCAVIPEACGDRNLAAHEMSLHDMHAKYAQALPLKQALDYLETL